MSNTNLTIGEDKKTFMLTRNFETTQDKIWEAYTSADLLSKWFAPEGWVCNTKSHDFSEGGEWEYALKCVDEAQGEYFGMEMPGKLVYDSINPKESFGYTDYFVGEDGEVDKTMPSSHTVVSFKSTDNGVLFSSVTTYDSEEALQQVLEMGMQEGIDQSHNKLAKLLS